MSEPWAPLLSSPAQGFATDRHPLGFAMPVASGGYGWWYIDALDDAGEQGLTIIAFVGSVFSPWYARERLAMQRGGPAAQPERHCALNVALYRKRGEARDAWAFTEHAAFTRDAEHFRLGRSSLRWQLDAEGPALVVELDERTAITGKTIRGRVIVRPAAIFAPRVELDQAGRHRWYPIAPQARVEVELESPALRFRGSAYHDVNEGDEGLEHAFARWDWSRTELEPGRTLILYDVAGAEPRAFDFRVAPHARTLTQPSPSELGPSVALAKTGWRIERSIRSDPGTTPTLLRTLEDTPFYSRNLIGVTLRGREGRAVHESVDLRRFASGWVRFLLPFRIRRQK